MIGINLLPLARRLLRQMTPLREGSLEPEDLVQEGELAYLEALPRCRNGKDTLARKRAEGAMLDAIRTAHRHRVIHGEFSTFHTPGLPRKVRRAIRGMRKTERDLIAKYLGRESLTQQEMVRMWRYKQKLKRFVAAA